MLGLPLLSEKMLLLLILLLGFEPVLIEIVMQQHSWSAPLDRPVPAGADCRGGEDEMAASCIFVL